MLRTIPGFRDSDTSRDTQLIELTAKRWKALKVIAVALGGLGLVFILWQLWAGLYRPLLDQGFVTEHAPAALREAFIGPAGVAGMAIFAAGLAVAIYARFMAWWHHG